MHCTKAGYLLGCTATLDMLFWAASLCKVHGVHCQPTAQEVWPVSQRQMWDRMCLISHTACRRI